MPVIVIEDNELGRIIRDRRRELGLTQEELEARSGISQTYISQVERGRVARPLEETLEGFAQALNIPLRTLRLAAGWLEVESVVVTEDAVEIPVLGTVPGVVPGHEEADVGGGGAVIRVLPEMVGGARQPFALRAIDDEWMVRGIVAGTYIVFESFDQDQDHYQEPADGDLVAVLIDGREVRVAEWHRERAIA